MTNTTQKLWPECIIRSKVMTGAGVSCKGYGALLVERDALRSRLADYELLKRAVNETGDCLPDCDSYAHNEQCPNVNNHVVLQDKQREIESLRSRLAEAEATLRKVAAHAIESPSQAAYWARAFLAADSASEEGEKC